MIRPDELQDRQVRPEPCSTGTAQAALTHRQAELLTEITTYYAVTREGCPARYLARRLQLHHETVRDHFAALFRKGWLRSETAPAIPRQPFLTRR